MGPCLFHCQTGPFNGVQVVKGGQRCLTYQVKKTISMDAFAGAASMIESEAEAGECTVCLVNEEFGQF